MREIQSKKKAKQKDRWADKETGIIKGRKRTFKLRLFKESSVSFIMLKTAFCSISILHTNKQKINVEQSALHIQTQ